MDPKDEKNKTLCLTKDYFEMQERKREKAQLFEGEKRRDNYKVNEKSRQDMKKNEIRKKIMKRETKTQRKSIA